ncbi:XRE family transcriptional regulator [Rhodobacter capsulatus]|uniref:XRE family transcriptional regulator n=1 Tax=Rhodobacter capsulatus TaxID=1061 RepID=UPI004027F843
METVGSRLKRCAAAKKMTEADIAAAIGMSKPAVNHYLNDRRQMAFEHLVTLADIFGVTTDFLLTGNTAPPPNWIDEDELVRAQVAGINGPKLTDADYALVCLSRAHVSAGPGHVPPEEHFYGSLAFNRAWLKREGVNPAAASLVRVKGDSMEPTLHDGSTVLVDHQRRDPAVRRGIYALRIGEEVFVKRLEKVGDVLVITSDNPTHSSRALGGRELADVEVIGRVVWQGYTFRDS